MNRKIIIAVTFILVLASVFIGCDMQVNAPLRDSNVLDPYISIQPESYSFVHGASDYVTPTLSIEVWEWEEEDGELSFQWYTFSTLENYIKGNVTAISGATDTSHTPDITPAPNKVFYFYVEVTNTDEDAKGKDEETGAVITTSTVRSEIAMISFSSPGVPVFPKISQNPADAGYVIGRTSAIASLDVRAEIPPLNGHSMRYQWYKFALTDGYEDGLPKGTAIAGATQRTYLPPKTDLSKGKSYYYVVIDHVRTNPDGFVTYETPQ